MDERTVRNYFHQYKNDGMEALITVRWKGSVAFLTSEQEKELGRYLDEHLFYKSKEIANYNLLNCLFN